MLGRSMAGGEGLSEEDYLTKEDKTVGWHHRPTEHESEQTPGDSEGQRSLACCSSWGRKESDTIERLSNSMVEQVFLLMEEVWSICKAETNALFLCLTDFIQWGDLWVQLPRLRSRGRTML